MIHFKNIKWQNFLSTGNAWTEIDFQRSPSTLIVGDNGSGKSTLLDALTYSLFNKPFRNVSIPQLINSINGKGMSVEINFAVPFIQCTPKPSKRSKESLGSIAKIVFLISSDISPSIHSDSIQPIEFLFV